MLDWTFNKHRRLSLTLLWRDLQLGKRVPFQSFTGILPSTVFLFISDLGWSPNSTPRDSTLKYKIYVHLWNNFPCIITLRVAIFKRKKLSYTKRAKPRKYSNVNDKKEQKRRLKEFLIILKTEYSWKWKKMSKLV